MRLFLEISFVHLLYALQWPPAPWSIAFHMDTAPEPGRLDTFGEPVPVGTNMTNSKTPVPSKLDEFGEGKQTTTTTTTTTTSATEAVATTKPAKQLRRGDVKLPDAYEPRYQPRKVGATNAGSDGNASSNPGAGQPQNQVETNAGAVVDEGSPTETAGTAQADDDAPAEKQEGTAANVTEKDPTSFKGKHVAPKVNPELQNVSTEDACAHCAAAKMGKASATQPDLSHGPEVRSNAMSNVVDVTTNGGRARLLAKGEVTLDSCRRTTRKILELIAHGMLKKDDLGGNLAPICLQQARGEFNDILLKGDFLNRADERALQELCFKFDGRLTMAIQDGELLPRLTVIGMRTKGTPESFCEGFGRSVYPKKELRKLPDLPDGNVGIPTVPPTPPPDPLELAVQWATGLSGFHSACVTFLHEFQADVSNTVQLTSRRFEDPEGSIEISHAFPWSKDFKGFQTCQDAMSDARENRSETAPAAFNGKDWPKRICLDLALGYISVRSAHPEASQGLVAEAQAFTVLSRATPDTFCRTYEAQFGQQAPPGAAGNKGQMPAKVNDPQEGGLSGQMSGNEDPPGTPKLTRSASANHAEQKQRGTEKKTHWMTGTMAGPNHDIKSF